MELYMENKENRRMILNSIQNGPLVWPTIIQEDGTTRTKKYEELSVTKKLQADYDLKATNIILQGLPSDVYAIVSFLRIPVYVLNQGDDTIAYLNKAMDFLLAVATLRLPLTNNQLRTSSSERDMDMQCTQPKRPRNDAWFKDKICIPDCQAAQITIPNNVSFHTKDLDAYDFDCDYISNAKAVLMANLSNYGSNVILEKAQRIKPTLYDGSVISSQHAVITVIDDEETLILEEILVNILFQQVFWLQTSNLNIEQYDISPVSIEAPSEHPKVRRLKGKNVLDSATTIPPQMFKLDLDPLAPSVISLVQVAATPRAMDIADSPVSTLIDQDTPLSSIPSTQEQEQSPNLSQGVEECPKTPHFHDDPLHKDSTSQGSSSNVQPSHNPFKLLVKWTKNQPIENLVGDPSRLVSTRKQLQTNKYGMLSSDPIDTLIVDKSKLDKCLHGKPVDPTHFHVALDNALVASENRVQISKCNMRIDPIKTPKEPTYQVVLDYIALSLLYLAFLITSEAPEIYIHQFCHTITKIKNSSLYKSKLDKKKWAIVAEVFCGVLQICGLSEGIDLESEVSDEPKGNSINTSKGTGLKLGFLDVSKVDYSESKHESWGDSDEDDDNNDQQSDDESTESDDDKSADLNKIDDEEEDKFIHTPDDYVPTDDENLNDEEYERINKEIYNDINVELKDAEPANEEKGDEEMTHAENVNTEPEEVSQEVAVDQVKDDAQATVTVASATQKTEVPLKSSSISFDHATKFLNFDNILSSETKIILMMDIKVQHKDLSIQTSPLLIVSVTVIPESPTAPATTIRPLIPPFISLQQQSTSIPTPTTIGATTSTTTVLDSETFSAIHLRVSDLEKEVKELKNVDHSLTRHAIIKSKVSVAVKEYLRTSLITTRNVSVFPSMGKIESINTDKDITLMDVETQEEVVTMDVEPQGRLNQEEVNVASKGVSAVSAPELVSAAEPTMAQKLHDEEVVGNKMHKVFPLPGESSHWQYKFPLQVEGVPTARRIEILLLGVCTAMMKKLPGRREKSLSSRKSHDTGTYGMAIDYCIMKEEMSILKGKWKEDNLGKFEAKGDEGYFIGYSMSSKAFRVFNKRTRRLKENLHRILRKRGTKDAADQKVRKNESSLRYILLPNWAHDALLETTSSKPYEESSTQVPEGSGNTNPIASTFNPSAERIETLTVESPIPTVSSPVPTACLNNSSETSSKARLVSKRVANQEETPSLDNILSLTNKFDDILGVSTSSDEIIRVEADKVWTLFDCPKGVRPIRIKWVLKNKKDESGIVVRNKARLVAQGHTQEEGIDYDEVFAPVARIEAIRLFLAYASFMGFTVYQMDVKSAFLYGTIDEEVYVMQPPGFHNPVYPAKVYKVEKAMYRLHQAPRACGNLNPTASTSNSPADQMKILTVETPIPTIKFEDINQIDDDDMEEMDIKWNMALLSMRANKFWKRIRKKISIQGSDVAGFDKSKVECFNCHKMGHFARECRAPRSQERARKESYRQGSKAE
uniref:Retrovirus-related Pol polyprotein from transposon TNT 1-94 n=1 Tax=Tanacetum cinerariifolium TaxID=118510 RepID=A0A6L2JWU4_TANCI|nr:retrovirus-related Pol polyprotein from transposon TNT 1-94 [Tanacetum cinerariifolium]